ncbi:MAG: GTP 3',8-cyclase MoaA [Methylacidiphilales bacterium]|nr:GTP 3',8-cyclase MoaA [Candidatus Methylacidiphilales bacterium]
MNTDPHGRVIDYLRISVTDRCNERCLYCMPEGYKGWAQKPDHLSADEIVRAAKAACALGFRKFRLTGGEPLIRGDIVGIAERLWNLSGVETLGISSNGTRLKELARPLRQAGVRSINVSLDALDADIYHKITGGRLADVIEGIDAALDAGFERIKLNCVLMRDVTESQLPLLLDFASARNIPIRFIELMPLSDADVLNENNFLPVSELMRLISRHDELIPAQNERLGHGPARYYRLKKANVLTGFIGALTNLDFCGACNKLRLTADGNLRPCLGQHGEMDLKPVLRLGSDQDLIAAFAETIRQKPLDHSFRDHYKPQRPMIAIGG